MACKCNPCCSYVNYFATVTAYVMFKFKITSVYTSIQTRDQLAVKCTRFANASTQVEFSCKMEGDI